MQQGKGVRVQATSRKGLKGKKGPRRKGVKGRWKQKDARE